MVPLEIVRQKCIEWRSIVFYWIVVSAYIVAGLIVVYASVRGITEWLNSFYVACIKEGMKIERARALDQLIRQTWIFRRNGLQSMLVSDVATIILSRAVDFRDGESVFIQRRMVGHRDPCPFFYFGYEEDLYACVYRSRGSSGDDP